MGWSGFLPEIAPGRYQKFSAQHLQLWWAEQQADFVIRPLSKGLRSQLLYNWMLRELGANVHASANISQSTEWFGPLSLLTVERNAIVQAGAQISMVVWEGQHCTVNAVHICAGCTCRKPRHALQRRLFRGEFMAYTHVLIICNYR